VADLPGKVASYAEERHCQTILMTTPEGIEQWRYLLPAWRLNQRDGWPLPDSDVWKVLANANTGELFKIYLKSNEHGTTLMVCKPEHALQNVKAIVDEMRNAEFAAMIRLLRPLQAES
jgi:hypothetical protein